MRHLFFAAYHGNLTFVLPALNASEYSKVCDEIVIVIVVAQCIQRKRAKFAVMQILCLLNCHEY